MHTPAHRHLTLRFITALLTASLLPTPSFAFQDQPIRFQIAITQTRAEILKICGKPFGLMRVNNDDLNASIGAVLGLWTVFHLTPSDDRTYASMAHFSSVTDKVDALMFEPVGFWSVEQFLLDHPQLATICADSCTVEQVTEKTANQSLLLRPSKNSAGSYALYFIGDTGSRFKSISSMESIVSWAYMVPLDAFEAKHTGYKRTAIGEWNPRMKPDKL